MFNEPMNLTELDIIVVIVISFLTSVLIVILYELVKNYRKVYIDTYNKSNLFYGNGKNGYLEKIKTISDKTRYIEESYLLSFYNNTYIPCVIRNIRVVTKKRHKIIPLLEGTLNINGTDKSVAGVSTYDKLKNIVVRPYEALDYDVNIRLSKKEYEEYKKVYIAYKGRKNKEYYIRLKIKKDKNKKK